MTNQNNKPNINYLIRQLEEYDDVVKLFGKKVPCFSKKELKKFYQDKEYKVVGEICEKNQPKQKDAKYLVTIGKNEIFGYEDDHFNKLLYRTAGYLCVGDDEYLMVVENRLLFIILLFGLLIGLLIGLYFIIMMAKNPVLNPDYNLPDRDPSQKPSGEELPQISADGGRFEFTTIKNANISLSDKSIEMFFLNPAENNQDVSIEILIKGEDDNYLIAKSGLVNRGNFIDTMVLKDDIPTINPGGYDGYYRVICYNSITGDLSQVSPYVEIRLNVYK